MLRRKSLKRRVSLRSRKKGVRESKISSYKMDLQSKHSATLDEQKNHHPFRQSSLKKLGKRGLQWQRIRKELKERFRKAGITRCEICGSNFALGFAHRKKRAYCDEEELYKVALLCNDPCHREADSHGAQHMFDTINAIIKGRAIQP